MGKILWIGVGTLGNNVINKIKDSENDSYRYLHIKSWGKCPPEISNDRNTCVIGLLDPDITGFGAMSIEDGIKIRREMAVSKEEKIRQEIIKLLHKD